MAAGTTPIARLHNPTSDEFLEQYGYPGIPVVITGCMKTWKAMESCRPEVLARDFGDVEVSVYRTRRMSNVRRVRLREFVEYVQKTDDPDAYYLGSWRFEHDIPELVSHFTPPDYFASWHIRLPVGIRPCWRWMFIGGRGTGTPLHVDTWLTSAWNGVVCGRKKWLFYSPDQRPLLYDGDTEPDTRPLPSYPITVDAFDPDLARYPNFNRATAIECVQESGEIVFTPSGWWHQVVNEETCVSLTENFVNGTNHERVMTSMERQAESLAKLLKLPSASSFISEIRQYIPEMRPRSII
jgi:histone arginine demethylase JMJD6